MQKTAVLRKFLGIALIKMVIGVAVVIQAAILITAAFIYTRSLWFSIFFHFAWDFAEPGIYGGLNPGISGNVSLLTSQITGYVNLTGGSAGPGASIQSIVFCFLTALALLWLAKRKHTFIYPKWKN